MIAAYPLWFAGSLLAAGAFVLWCVLAVVFYWGAA
jgi:hypothetical protein